MSKSRWRLLAVAVAGSVASCGGSASLEAVISVTTKTQGGSVQNALRASQFGRSALTLTSGERVSFTPTSLQITLRGLTLCPEVAYAAEAGGNTCGRDQHQIAVTSSPETIELAGRSALSNLLSFEAEIGDGDFGTYRGALLLYGDGGSTSNLKVGGTVDRSGQDPLSFTDAMVGMGTTGIGINMAQAVKLSDGSSSVVKILFDVEGAAYLGEATGSPQSAALPGGLGVFIDNLIFLPFVGSGEPQVLRFHVVLDSTAFGDPATWYLKVVALADSSGGLVSMGWQTVFVDGFVATGPTFAPGMLFIPVITPAGSGYDVREDTAHSSTLIDHQLSFSDFRLETHSGTLKMGSESYGYTATLQ